MSDTASDTAQSATTDTSAATTWLARIHVTLKPVVLDPQGEAVLHGLQQLGLPERIRRPRRQVPGDQPYRRQSERR